MHDFVIVDSVLRDLDQQVAAYPPERGGALLGLAGRRVVTRFLLDHAAETTPASYRPSRVLNARVQDAEQALGESHAGILHSHPSALDRPSGQDERELETSLRVNPHLDWYLAPIVTHGDFAAFERHECALTRAKVSFFVARRTSAGGVAVTAQPVVVLPLLADLERAAAALTARAGPRTSVVELDGRPFLAGELVLRTGEDLQLLVDELYPTTPPLVLLTGANGETTQLEVAWRLEVPPEQRLVHALTNRLTLVAAARHSNIPPAGKHAGRTGIGPFTEPTRLMLEIAARRRALMAGLGSCLLHAGLRGVAAIAAFWSAWPPARPDRQAEVRAGLFARTAGLVPESLADRTVLFVGLGSVGSQMAEGLVRSGLHRLQLVDPERVEATNLSRTVYRAGDIDRTKVAALTDRLLAINPAVAVEGISANLLDLEPQRLQRLVRQADLVVAATDDLAAQRVLNRVAYATGTPALFIGLYAGARGGEVITSVPGRTACYLCATYMRHAVEADSTAIQPHTDYGTGRLPGEVALGADIQHVVSVGVKLALALLLHDQDVELGRFLEPMLAEGSSYVTLGMAPDYWFYPTVFKHTPGQFAYQSVWLTPTRRPECPVCGDRPVDSLAVPLRAPRLAALRKLKPPTTAVVRGHDDPATPARAE